MYNILELEKISELADAYFAPYDPWVYVAQLTFPTVATFWTDILGAEDDTNKVNTTVTSIRFDNTIVYAEADTLNDCIATEQSFYWDQSSQLLYVHVQHNATPSGSTITGGNLYGFTDDTVRYFNHVLYRPLLRSVPAISQSADPLQYGIISFSGGSAELTNDGFFDDIEPLYGNLAVIKRGEEGDGFDDLTHVFTGYIKDYTTALESFTVDIGDKRERLQVETPVDVFDVDIDDTDGKLIPDGYGDVIQVPAYPIEEGIDRDELEFDGTNDYVEILSNGTGIFDVASFTIFARVYRKSTSNYTIIWSYDYTSHVSPYYAQHIRVKGDGALFIGYNIAGSYKEKQTAPGVVPLNQYVSIAFSFTSGDQRCYVNGEEVATYTEVGAITYYAQEVWIGRANFGYTKNALIKDVMFYDAVKSASDIASIHSGTDVSADRIGYWKLDEGTGTTATDTSGTNDGTISGATWVSLSGVMFRWATVSTSIMQVYKVESDLLSSVSHSNYLDGGTFVLAEADAYSGGDNTKALNKVYVTGRMRDYDNPADIIKDLNDRVADIEYTASNYNQAEWEGADIVALADVALYMDRTRRLYEWIEDLQKGSDYGFRYEDTDKITIRIDDPDRAAAATITALQIRNRDMPIRQNAELFATSVIVKHSKNHRTGTMAQVSDTSYEDDAVEEFRIKKQRIEESLLTNSTDAESKADVLIQDIHTVRPIVTLRLDVADYPSPRIFDIVDATVSLTIQGDRLPESWTYLFGDADYVLGDADYVIGEQHEETRTEAYTYENNLRTYYGELRGQVIGIQWLTGTNEIEIDLRQKAELEV
jgi:hypothetical protein